MGSSSRNHAYSASPRRRSVQTGNLNGRMHGFYSCCFTANEVEALQNLQPVTSVRRSPPCASSPAVSSSFPWISMTLMLASVCYPTSASPPAGFPGWSKPNPSSNNAVPLTILKMPFARLSSNGTLNRPFFTTKSSIRSCSFYHSFLTSFDDQ
jgi:hypothetical protein